MTTCSIKDRFCWHCHRSHVDFSCVACVRSYHDKCVHKTDLLCPECVGIERAEDRTHPSALMQWLDGSVDRLTQLLTFTIETVKAADKKRSFLKRSEDSSAVNPMDLSVVEDNIQKKVYASTNSFLADVKWVTRHRHVSLSHTLFTQIYHNCVANGRLVAEAKNVLRVAKQECEEIEICPDCYLNYYTLEEETYFAAVCRRPHAIVWAKLKGHPFWPAKVVRFNEPKHEVDVRFFGTHDKCWLKPDKCYLMSQNYPNTKKPSKFDQNKFDAAIRDMNAHLDQLDKHFKGLFQFHDKQTLFTPDALYLSYSHHVSDHVFNGTPLKNLKLHVTTFDIADNLCEVQSPPAKRLKNFRKCMAALPVRQELNSSREESVSDETEGRASKTVTVSGKSSLVLSVDRETEMPHRIGNFINVVTI